MVSAQIVVAYVRLPHISVIDTWYSPRRKLELGRRRDGVGQLTHWSSVGGLHQHNAAVVSGVDRVGDAADGGNEAVVIHARLQFGVAATGHDGQVAADDEPCSALAQGTIDGTTLVGCSTPSWQGFFDVALVRDDS